MDNDVLLGQSGVRWLVGVCGFRFSSKIFKLRISFCRAVCVPCAVISDSVRSAGRETAETGEREKKIGVVDEKMLISHVHNVTE